MSSNWDDVRQVLERADSARSLGERELAYQLYARASELNPQDAHAWQGRAETTASSDEALVSYGYAAALDPGNQPLKRTLDAALDQRLESAQTEDAPLLAAIGQELAEVGLNDRAKTVLERAVQLDPLAADALVWLAGISTDEQQRLDYLTRALKANPRDPRARAGMLSVKLPEPQTNPAPTDARPPELAPSARQTAASVTFPTTAEQEREAATMERLRQLRAGIGTSSAAPSPSERSLRLSRNPPSAANPRMRMLLLILLVLVVILALAGLILLLTQ